MPGMFAEATLTLEGNNDALAVPLAALDQTAGQASVFLVSPDNRLEERRVQIGFETSSDAEVLSGLAVGDRVVVSDRSGLKPGIEVRPQNADVMEFEAGKQ
jgi:membrane fusion protein (multidrug efflux system)